MGCVCRIVDVNGPVIRVTPGRWNPKKYPSECTKEGVAP